MTPKQQVLRMSPKQRKVIKDLRNGYVIIATSENSGATITSETDAYYINARVFWNLVEKELIYQQFSGPFNYILTDLGRSVEVD